MTLLSATAITPLAKHQCHILLLHRGLHHFPAGGFQFHPQLFLAVFVSCFLQQSPTAEHYAWWFYCLFVLFLLYCLYFKDIDSYLWIPSSHGEVSVVFLRLIYSIALNQTILQTELCISFTNSFFGG